jgi:hypothetical protein
MSVLLAKGNFLKLFIGFLTLTALIAIFFVLKGDFGEFEVKVLVTTFSISAASICSMSCAAFIEKNKQAGLGLVGIGLAALAALALSAGLWMEMDEEVYWKSTATLIVLALGCAHGFLLMLPDLDRSHKWSQPTASTLILILAIQIVAAIWGEFDAEGYYKLLAAVSIVVVLFTLTIPVLYKIRSDQGEARKVLLLTESDDGLYADPHGNTYKVERIKPGPSPDGGEP